MKLFENMFVSLIYDVEYNVLKQIWTEASEEMTDDNYMEIQLKTLELFKEKGANKIFVDVVNFKYIIIIEMQEWTVENILNKLIEAGIEKTAYITSNDLFAQISVEQTIDEEKQQKFIAKYFQTPKEAYSWLLSD